MHSMRFSHRLLVRAASTVRGRRLLHPAPQLHLASSAGVFEPRATRAFATAAAEKHEFQAEARNLLDIVAKSLYSDSEVFIRELISNASDALEKRRIAELLSGGGQGYIGEIRLETDEKTNTIRFEDSGIGMNRADLVAFLGTIGQSGSKEFIKENADKTDAVIGQFGVGFYSAFMVADRVVLRTKKAEEECAGLEWTWNGDNTYEIAEKEGISEGTSIEIHLKAGDSADFSKTERVKEVVQKYSYFVTAPITLNGERVNSLNAIWTSNPKEVSKEQHETFFNYLRFVIGVVDSEDVPLNLSREMLQNNPVLIKLRRILTEKVLSFFVQQQKKDLTKYTEFYRSYSLFFKEGIITEPEQTVKEDIARLLLFESSERREGTLTSLSEYITKMQEGQKEIYYMYAPSRQLAESSPYFEVVKGEGKQVIFLLEPADEVVFLALGQFNGHQLISVEKWAKEHAKDEKEEKGGMQNKEKKELFDWVKNTLGSVKVHDVVGSHRPSEHPAMVSVQQEMGAARHFLRMGESKDQEHLVFFQPTFHLHLSHPLIKSLVKLRRSDEKTARLLIEQVYDNALITAGLMNESRKMIPRLNELLSRLAGAEKSPILTP